MLHWKQVELFCWGCRGCILGFVHGNANKPECFISIRQSDNRCSEILQRCGERSGRARLNLQQTFFCCILYNKATVNQCKLCNQWLHFCGMCLYVCVWRKMAESNSRRPITSTHATAVLHQSWPTHSTFQKNAFVVAVFFFLSLLTIRVPHSIPHPLRTYRLSVNAYQIKAGSPSLLALGRACVQSGQASSGSSRGKMGICLISEITGEIMPQ